MKMLTPCTQIVRTLISPNFGNFKYNEFVRFLHFDSYYKCDPSEAVFSYNRAIDGHVKSGSMPLAHQVFDEMSVRDVVSWNLLISGYKRHGMPTEAINLYSEMVGSGVTESPSTFSSVLGICGDNGFYSVGVRVHSRVNLLGLSENLYLGSSIVDFYMQMGAVDDGLKVLYQMPERNVAVWNVVLRGLCKSGMWDEVLEAFSRVKYDGFSMNEPMLCYLLQGCYNGNFVSQGERLHSHALKAGWVESNNLVANALVDFYAACGSIDDAQRSFELIPPENVISWNSIMSAYAKKGLLSDALGCFRTMQLWSMTPTVASVVATLNACAKSQNIFVGRQMHCSIVKLGFEIGNIDVLSALIDMYVKCNELERAKDIYESSNRIRECCNALLTSMLHCGLADEVIEFCKIMANKEGAFDEFSLSWTMKALSLSSFESLSYICDELHSFAIKSGLFAHSVVSCSLVDSYTKVGQVNYARQVFEGLASPDIASFTSLIIGCAWNGLGRECLKLLERMMQEGLKPDTVTFLCVLIGCNQSGLVEEGKSVFNLMRTHHGIAPDKRHYACMVDLLSRAGLVYEAEELLSQSNVNDDSSMWSTLLRSCRMHKNGDVGHRVAQRLMELAAEDPDVCLQVSDFYSEVGDSQLSTHYRQMAKAREVPRERGRRFIP